MRDSTRNADALEGKVLGRFSLRIGRIKKECYSVEEVLRCELGDSDNAARRPRWVAVQIPILQEARASQRVVGSLCRVDFVASEVLGVLLKEGVEGVRGEECCD